MFALTGPSKSFEESIKLANFHPRQGNLFQRNNFSVVYKASLHFTKQGGDLLKNFSRFSNNASSSVAPRICMNTFK
jgi:hypothetical protein